MGGKAGMTSVEGKGSTFWFTAVLRKDAPPHNEPTRVSAEDAERTIRQKLGSKRILLVEDEPINREIAQALLEDVSFIVDLAEDGGKAIERVQAATYDLILMRWRYLKDDAGAALLQSLREFLDEGKLILGICNGFQLLVKLGVLPALGGQRFERQVSLGNNDSARFEDRWVHLLPNAASPCVFTKNLPLLSMVCGQSPPHYPSVFPLRQPLDDPVHLGFRQHFIPARGGF